MEGLELLRSKVIAIQNYLMIDRMPTITEMRNNRSFELEPLINKYGGNKKVSELLDIPLKLKTITMTEKDVDNSILQMLKELEIERMPVTSETLKFGGQALHNNIVRKGGYRYFAEKLNLQLKQSETSLGQDYEYTVIDMLKEEGYEVEKMKSLHPYDLLVNGSVKVDVKVSNLSIDKEGYRVHTFGINKKNGSCDIYIAITLDENKEIERLLVIPSHHLKVVTLCIGKQSKYDKYLNKFYYLDMYSKFFNSVV